MCEDYLYKSYFSVSNYYTANLSPRFSSLFGLKKNEPKSFTEQIQEGYNGFDSSSFTQKMKDGA